MRNKLLLLGVLMSLHSYGANVVWGGGEIAYYAPGDDWGRPGAVVYEWGWYDDLVGVNMFMDADVGKFGWYADFTIFQSGSKFVEVDAGDRIDAAIFGKQQFPEERFSINELYSVILAFETKDLGMTQYGWVEIGIDERGKFAALNGAIDTDGGPMIAGAGAVPEPSSGLMILVGVVGLLLRRRTSSVATERGKVGLL